MSYIPSSSVTVRTVYNTYDYIMLISSIIQPTYYSNHVHHMCDDMIDNFYCSITTSSKSINASLYLQNLSSLQTPVSPSIEIVLAKL